MTCTCSKYCREHGGARVGGLSEVGYYGVGIHKGVPLTSDTKGLLCRLVNDKAIKKLCQDASLMISLLTEQTYDTESKCLGLNENAKNIFVVLKDTDGNILPYTDIIAIILHELVHHTHFDHDENFIELEKTYREKYIKYARQTGQIPSWIEIVFPESTGSSLKLNISSSIAKVAKVPKVNLRNIVLLFASIGTVVIVSWYKCKSENVGRQV
jgi:hypothetical protein